MKNAVKIYRILLYVTVSNPATSIQGLIFQMLSKSNGVKSSLSPMAPVRL